MKAVKIGLFAIGVLVVGVLTLYLTRASETRTWATPETAAKVHDAPADLLPTPSPGPDELGSAQAASSEEIPIEESRTTIPVSREFDRIFGYQRPGGNTGSSIKLHEKLEQERRDPEWAAETEQVYRNFIHGSTDLHSRGVVPEIDCRATLCELRLIASGADKDTDWAKLLLSMPWPPGGSPVNFDWDYQGGVTAVIVHVMFKRQIPSAN